MAAAFSENMVRQFKSLSIYAFTIFFNAAISFGTFSLLTHHLNEVDYGIINLYNSAIILLVPFISIGVQFILSVDYFKMDHHAYRKHFSNALLIPFALCVLLTVVCLAGYKLIENLVKVNFFFAIILPLVCFITILNEVILNLIRDKGKHFLFARYSISKNVMEIGLTIFLIIGLGLGWQGRLGSSFIALLIMLVVIILLIRKWDLWSGNFDKKEVSGIFKSGLPFVPERLAIFILGYSDRFFIDYYSGTADVGYYSAGAQIAIIVNLVILTLNNAFFPFIFKKLAQENVDYLAVRKGVLSYIGIMFGITIFVLIAIPFIFKYFVGPAFLPGQKYAVNLTIGLFFWAVYNVFISFLLYSKKNKTIMLISMQA
jgi:O-antigen/teichoic acid export membrane protein